MYNKRNVKQSHNIRYIVVHCTATRRMLVNEMDKLPYHFLITRAGKPVFLNAIRPTDGTIEIAWLGGLDKNGKHVDNRTPEQEHCLCYMLLALTGILGDAEVKAADELYRCEFPNPGFDLKAWLDDYMPVYLQEAA